MFDPTHIISQLTESQKIRMLTDIRSLSEPELSALGVPQVICGSALAGGGGVYPSPAHLARSWDKALLSEVTEAQCMGLHEDGVHHVFLPGARTRLNAFGDALSEDPCLAGELAGAILAGAAGTGCSVSLGGYGMTVSEAACVHEQTAARVVWAFQDAPYLRALREGQGAGMVTAAGTPITLSTPPDTLLCHRASDRETVKALVEGRICLSGSEPALQNALHRYRRLKADILHGRATKGELDAACAEGEAISEETLDAAVARLLAFAHDCHEQAAHKTSTHPPRADLAYRAALSTVVLLENRRLLKGKRNALPLTSPTRLCLVGDLAGLGCSALSEAVGWLTAGGHTVVGHAAGYELGADRNDDLLAEAVSLAEQADTVLLFLGTDAAREAGLRKTGNRRLPANQQALCDSLSRSGKTVIAVLSGHVDMDMSFVTAAVHPFSAVLLASLDVPEGLRAAIDILLGKQAPVGRLPVTLCAHTACPDLFGESRRVGPFVGYRYYDTIGYGALYPFGHGLSYTSFRYTDLHTQEQRVTFTVKNTGKRACVELAQVYLGIEASAVLRPKKELVGFARLELAPGQETTITLPLEIPAVYTEEGERLAEAGTYTLSVGSSVSDIRLQTTLTLGIDTVPSDGEDPADYLPSVSNVHTQRYVMEAEYTPMKPSLRNLLFGIIALCLAVSLKFYDILTAADAVFLDIVAGILAVGAAVCFVMEIRDRRRQNAIDRARMEDANLELFEGATPIPAPSATELFADDLYIPADAVEDASETEKEGDYDYLADVDKTLTFSEAARELAILAREKGLLLSETTVNSILAALATSRLVMVRGVSDAHFSALVALLGEYFAGAATLDTVDESYRSESDVLVAVDESDASKPRCFSAALEIARSEKGAIHLAALTNVDPASMSDYFVPFVRHAHAPRAGSPVAVQSVDGETEEFRLPENLWFLLRLKEGTSLHTLPDYVAEVATVHTWQIEQIAPASERTSFRRFSYGQMEYLCDRLRSGSSVDEEAWKKIDRLEAYAARFGEFRMGNKLWLGLELYMAALLSMGVTQTAALDETVAVKLLPALIPALSGRIHRDERGLCETLDAIFGDDCTALCRRTVKESGADLV